MTIFGVLRASCFVSRSQAPGHQSAVNIKSLRYMKFVGQNCYLLLYMLYSYQWKYLFNCFHCQMIRNWKIQNKIVETWSTFYRASVIVWLLKSRPRLNTKTVFPRYGDFHAKDKTVVRPSYLLHGDPYTGKTTSLYWDAPPDGQSTETRLTNPTIDLAHISQWSIQKRNVVISALNGIWDRCIVRFENTVHSRASGRYTFGTCLGRSIWQCFLAITQL